MRAQAQVAFARARERKGGQVGTSWAAATGPRARERAAARAWAASVCTRELLSLGHRDRMGRLYCLQQKEQCIFFNFQKHFSSEFD
jgi:hypothetical protein